MDWQEILEHPSLQDLPFKIETNEWGQIVMSPLTNRRGARVADVSRQLRDRPGEGATLCNAVIATSKGTKVADVVWVSEPFLKEHGYVTPFPKAPEICVEVLSPPNSRTEMQEKIVLYLAKGAQEVWLCSDDGRLSFFGHEGEREASRLAPDFPRQI